MRNVYICIKQLREKMDSLIDGNLDNLQNPEVIDISQKLDMLIFESMIEDNTDEFINKLD